MVKAYNRLKWTPNPPRKRPDNIISSKAREKHIVAFIPKCEEEKVDNMWKLMSNEYLREWFKEWAVFNKNVYTREQIIKEESKIQRKWIQRMMTYRRPTKFEMIEERLWKPISKGASGNKIDIRCKYKPSCTGLTVDSPHPIKGRNKKKTTKDSKEENEKSDGLRGNIQQDRICMCNQKPLIRLCRCGISQ
ncbi:unnamed protein product [Callosobruchus maculatus]|uniref:Uncharacterized protein n=1 Tax=Callosobruchus maculatus TaxID=64391 RepID=A0A653CH55_CALMS|nr:unnamed protein product [Callosobruchus maculatus]